jgi:hypothetical protein
MLLAVNTGFVDTGSNLTIRTRLASREKMRREFTIEKIESFREDSEIHQAAARKLLFLRCSKDNPVRQLQTIVTAKRFSTSRLI